MHITILLSFALIVFDNYRRYTSSLFILLIRLISKMPTWVSKSLQGQDFYGPPFNRYFCYFSLIQVALGCLLLQDFSLQQDTTRIFRAAQRMSRCTYTPQCDIFHVQKLSNATETCVVSVLETNEDGIWSVNLRTTLCILI